MIETLESMKLHGKDVQQLLCVIEDLHHRLSRCTEEESEVRKKLQMAQCRINAIGRLLNSNISDS